MLQYTTLCSTFQRFSGNDRISGTFRIRVCGIGIVFGFFLPGDSLIFTAGLLASQGYFSGQFVLVIVAAGAILGDSVGYWFGRHTGRYLHTRNDSMFFKKEYIDQAEVFYEKHGAKTIVIARFVPVVRTFAPIIAGASSMKYEKFFWYNAAGGIFWTLLLVLLGYFLGTSVPNINHYLLVDRFRDRDFSFAPVFWKMMRMRKEVL